MCLGQNTSHASKYDSKRLVRHSGELGHFFWNYQRSNSCWFLASLANCCLLTCSIAFCPYAQVIAHCAGTSYCFCRFRNRMTVSWCCPSRRLLLVKLEKCRPIVKSRSCFCFLACSRESELPRSFRFYLFLLWANMTWIKLTVDSAASPRRSWKFHKARCQDHLWAPASNPLLGGRFVEHSLLQSLSHQSWPQTLPAVHFSE